MTINIARDYTKTPGGRYTREGKYSGEDFRERLLMPAYKQAEETNDELVVILDGGYGYGSSFLEEAFGGLARQIKSAKILSIIKIVSEEEPRLIEDIKEYMEGALNAKR